MKNLIEISKIITKKKIRKIETFDGHSLKHKNSKFTEFYEALMANKFKNDRDAASMLYACSPTDDKYRQLKSRFKKRLFNTLFFLDINQPSTSSYDRAYYSCNKDWTLIKILVANKANVTAISLARQVLNSALKYKFADIIVNCSRVLRKFAAKEGGGKNYDVYDQHVKLYTNVLDAEIRSEELYQRVIINYYKPLSKKNDLTERIATFCDDLVGLSETYNSPIVFYNMYLVWVIRYEMLHDYDAMLEVCNQAENYIEENPNYHQNEKLITFQLKKMSAYLHLRDYKNGKINAEKCLRSFPTGSGTWFTFMEYYLLLAIHTDNYINALAIFNNATGHSRFKKLSNFKKEKWNVFNIYINYIIESQSANNPVLTSQRKNSFRLSRLLNDPLRYPKDHRVLTTLIMIAQILFLLEKKNFNEVIELTEKLKSYTTRLLKKEEYYRATQFIRLLLQLSKADFKEENLSNVEKYYSRLLDRPFFYRGMKNEMEVIPYEKLWDMVLEGLRERVDY